MKKFNAGFLELIDKPNWFTRLRYRFCLFHKWFCHHGFKHLYYKGVPIIFDPSIPEGKLEIRDFSFNNLYDLGKIVKKYPRRKGKLRKP